MALLVALVDIRRGLEVDDHDLLALAAAPAATSRRPVQTLLVATKSDKLSASARKPALLALRQTTRQHVLPFSIKDPQTHVALWRELRRMLGMEPADRRDDAAT